jgi:hypothetical protein
VLRYLSAAAVLALAGCASTPMETRPIAGFSQAVPAQQAEAECRFEVEKATAGEQNLGIIMHISENVMESCLAAKGYQQVAVTP